jgi:methionine-rich copper-binding protein CopC
MRRSLPACLAALAGLLAAACAPSLAVPPHLIAVWPTPGTRLPIAIQTFELTFNHPLRVDVTSAAISRDEDGAPLGTRVFIDPANTRRMRVRLADPTAGNYRLRWHAVSADSNLAADGEQFFSLQDEATLAPHLLVSKATADSGQVVQVTGSGFGHDCRVRLTIGDDDQPLATAQTDDNGNFVADATVPDNTPYGVQPVAGIDAWGDAATAALEVRWGGWPPLVAQAVAQPGPEAGEVSFSLNLRNRSDYVLEAVKMVLDTPDDGTLVAAQPPPRQQDGSVAWEIPMIDRGVLGPFRATYRVPHLAAVHASVEFRHRRSRGCVGDDCLPAFLSESRVDTDPVEPAH